MSRSLVLCMDGTWNRADAPFRTNVALTAQECRCEGHAVYYDRGVGTGRWDRIRGGIFGVGLAQNVLEAYVWLTEHYRVGDRVFLFGYSRGAWTARSLAGLIGRFGIQSSSERARRAMTAYRNDWGPLPPRQRPYAEGMTADGPKAIAFLGVWDTVGALGVPIDGLRGFGARRFRFHDVRLGRHIESAVHLVATCERRKPFAPALWTGDPAPGQHVEQTWFPGVHADVGGGRPFSGLSGRALKYMLCRAVEAGLGHDGFADFIERPIELCRLGDSMTSAYRLLGQFERPIGATTNERIHQSALDLLEASPTFRDGPSGRKIVAALDAGVPLVA